MSEPFFDRKELLVMPSASAYHFFMAKTCGKKVVKTDPVTQCTVVSYHWRGHVYITDFKYPADLLTKGLKKS